MLNVLLESRAPRARRMRSTLASALVHAGLITGAVALTMPGPVRATPAAEPPIIHIVPPPRPVPPSPAGTRPAGPSSPAAPTLPNVPLPDFTPDHIPPVDVGPSVPPDEVVIGRGIASTPPIGAGGPSGLGAGGAAVDERLVDRAPRLLAGAAEPRYPASLRAAGLQGRVVAQFVVDTLGRAELDELQVVETPHPLFTDAVRAALARYRFSVGEAQGRRVRTRVQLPFDFTLVR